MKYPRLYNRIRSLRLTHDPPLRQVDLASRSGCDQHEISEIEQGVHVPNIVTAFKIALVLGKRVEYVFEGAEAYASGVLGEITKVRSGKKRAEERKSQQVAQS